MKKFLILCAAALTALAACNKPDPVPDPDEVKLTTDALVNVGAASEIVTIKFTSNVAWTASVAEDFVSLNKKAGEAGEAEVKATLQSLPEDVRGRSATVKITAGTASAEVVINQGIIFLITPDYLEAGIAGGKFSFKVISNTEYSVKTYDSFDWAPATFDQATGEGSFTVAKNEGYDLRTAYVKFTVPAIQDPVLDEETGEPTGETEDHVARIYLSQEGNAKQAWAKSLPADFSVANTDEPVHDATVSIALFNGKILVCDATKVYSADPATGTVSTLALPEGLPVQSIANDDAGNLLLADLIPYGGVGKIYAVKAGDASLANPKLLIPFVNDAWSGSRGADKVAARGDVYGNGVVTMIYGGVGSYGGATYGLIWEVKDGNAPVVAYNEWNNTTNQAKGWFTMPALTDDLWLSNRAVFVPAGPAVSDGFFYGGYDGLYNIYYHDGTDWNAVVPEVGNWAYAPNGMATTTWNGKKILACVNMAYFPEWGMPSQLLIVDVTNPKQPNVLSTTEYVNSDETFVTGAQESSTTSVVLQVEGDNLNAFVVDSAWGLVFKMTYPKL